MHPPFFFVLAKKNAPCTVEEKAAWCPNPAWRQVWAKTGVLAGGRRIFADWSPRWARAGVLPNPPVFSPRRNGGTYPGCESNWLCSSFTVSACGPRSISVTSVPLVPPSAAAPWVIDDSELEDYRPSISGGEVQNRGPQPPGLVGQEGVWGNPIERVPPRSLLDRARPVFSFRENGGRICPPPSR